MSDGDFEGGCLCGAMRYRVTGSPLSSSLCHCRSCRRASGAPSVAWFVVPESRFAFLTGTPSTIRSSPPVVRSFCGACGTPLTYRHDDNPQNVEITTASLDDPERLPPACEIWFSQKLSWAASNPDINHFSCEREDGRKVVT